MNNSPRHLVQSEQTTKPVQIVTPIQTVSKEENTRQTISLKTTLLIVQAILIVVMGNISVLSGDPLLEVIPSMISQGISLIREATHESEHKSDSDK